MGDARTPRESRASDEAILHMLDLRENDGLPMAAIAERMGVTRNAVIGHMNRIRWAHQDCACDRPENRDGGMPRRWWA